MTQEERVAFWACFELGTPPPGFDDWYIAGSPKSGVLGAFPTKGFMYGVHESEASLAAAKTRWSRGDV
jgi:hypothetical protein